jgi:hypothetical protein
MYRRTIASSLCLAGLFLSLTGCDTKPQSSSDIIKKDPLLSALSKVGVLYQNYHDAHQIGPANWEEMLSMAGSDQANIDAIKYVRDKGYDLKWGMKFKDVTGGMSNTVLGQSSQESAKLFFDGSVSK